MLMLLKTLDIKKQLKYMVISRPFFCKCKTRHTATFKTTDTLVKWKCIDCETNNVREIIIEYPNLINSRQQLKPSIGLQN